MKRSIPLLAVFLMMAMLLVSCGGDGGETTPAGSEAGGTVALSDLSSYTLVYPYEPDAALFRAAVALRDAIRERTGITLPMKDDFVGFGQAVPTGTKEILVGTTNRPESTVYGLKKDETGIYLAGDRLVISGGSPNAAAEAVTAFIGRYLGEDGVLYAPQTPQLTRASYPYGDATLGGTPLYEYVIAYESKSMAMAVYLQGRIADATGYYLPLYLSREASSFSHRIYVGARATGMTAATEGKYRIEWKDGSLGLYGADTAGTYAAVMAFAEGFAGAGDMLALSYPASTVGDAAPIRFFTLNLPGTVTSLAGEYDLLYSADAVLDRFFAAKADMPEKVTVIEPVSLSDYPMSAATAIYVSEKGSDSATGTKDAPLATPGEAVKRMQSLGGGVIWMMGGTYTLTDSLKLDTLLRPSPEAPIFIKAYEEAEVILTSNKTMDTAADKWHFLDPSDNADVWARIPEEARDFVVYTTLAEQGFTEKDIPEITKSSGPPSLFVSGETYTLAQYPNKTNDPNELLYFTAVYDTGTVTARDASNLYWSWVDRATAAGKDPASWIVGWEIRLVNDYDNVIEKSNGKTAAGFRVNEKAHEMAEEVLSWVNTGDIWYYGSIFEGWEFAYYNLALETEGQYWAHTEDGEEWYPSYGSDPLLGYPKGMAPDGTTPYYSLKAVQNNAYGAKVSANSAAGWNTYYLFNAVEALDAPGEWFYDKESGILYLYPTEAHEDLANETVACSASRSFPLISISSTSYIVLDGLTVDGTTGRGLDAQKSAHIIVQNCTFRNTQGEGASLRDCTDSAVIYSDFSAANGTMLSFNAQSSALGLDPCNNVVQNCFFHDPMPLKQVGLYWSGFRMVASHNYFNNTNTIGQNSVECIIEYNRFEGGSKDITDGGMIYSGGAFNRGNHYRHNLIHMFNATHNAIYNDGMGSGNYMYYNVVSTLHSKSDHNKPWYSSTGWGNVSYANLTLMRTPAEVVAAGANSSVESDITVFQSAQSGDTYNESALFYYYFGDQYSAGGTAARYKPVDYDGNPQLDYKVGANGKVSFTSQPTLTQSLAGHWWVGKKTSEVTSYLGKGDLATWWEHAP